MSEKPVNQIDIDSDIIKANDINSVINIKINDVNNNPVNLENEIEYFYLVRNDKYYPVTDITFSNGGISFKLPNLYKGLYKIEIKDKKGSIYPANDDISILLNQSFESGKESEFINMKDSILKDVPEMVTDYITENEEKFKGDKGVKGDKGDKGDPGLPGFNGKDGVDGKDGVNGKDGEDGEDGEQGDPGQIGSLYLPKLRLDENSNLYYSALPNVIKNGLVLWYDFAGKTNSDTNITIVEDLSGNGNSGMLQNFNFTAESGYNKNKLLFDGLDDYIDVDIPINDFTITFSLELTGTDDQFFFGGDINGFYLRKYLGNRLHASIYTDTQKTIQSLGVFKNTGETEKHSVGLILDSQRLKVGLIHNGVIIQEEDLTSSTIPFNLKTLGKWWGDSRRLTGGMFSASVYNRPLTPEEITHNYTIEKERFSIE